MKTKKKNVFDLNVAKDSETSVCQDVSNFFPRLRVSLLRIQYSLYLSLLAKALLPTIYSSVRVSLLGDLPSDAGVNIASQVSAVVTKILGFERIVVFKKMNINMHTKFHKYSSNNS